MTDFQIKNGQQGYEHVVIQKQGLPSNQPATVVSAPTKLERSEEKANSSDTSTSSVVHDQREAIEEKVAQLNDHMQNLNRSLQFAVDEGTGDSVIIVRDAETDELIHQFPSEEVLRARSMIDSEKGLLLELEV